MSITFQNSFNAAKTLTFDEQEKNFLLQKLDKDAAFQRRIKIIVIIAAIILLAGGIASGGICFSVLIPFGLLHTMLACGSTSAAVFGGMALGASSVELDDLLIANATKRPNCRKLKMQIQTHVEEANDRESTSCTPWRYLTKCDEEYKEYLKKRQTALKEMLDGAFAHNTPNTYMPLIQIIEAYNPDIEMSVEGSQVMRVYDPYS